MPALSELAVAKVRRFCESRIPPHVRDKIHLEVQTRGKAITIFERRPPWREDFGPEWSKLKIAQFRWDPNDRTWTIWWADRNGRWLRHPDADPTPDIGELVEFLDGGRSGAFWG